MMIKYLFAIIAWSAGYCAMAQTAPKLTKLPFAFPQANRTPMENSPVWFDSSLLLVSNYRTVGYDSKGEDAYLYIEDLRTGAEVARFGKGHSFVTAYAEGNILHVYALEFKNFGRVMNSTTINHFYSSDLKSWQQEIAIQPDGGEHLFNSSVCKDDKGYIMAYESDKPVQFCYKFARSTDLKKWKKIEGLAFTGQKKEYAACPVIRYMAPWYYVIYLHAPVKEHNGWISYIARSTDLKTWEMSAFNPILEAGPGEGKNNSDVDLIELDGKTYLFYATGDQESWGTVRVALFDGNMKSFFESYFPAEVKFEKASALQ